MISLLDLCPIEINVNIFIKKKIWVSSASAALTPSTTLFTVRAQAEVQDLITILALEKDSGGGG